MMAGSLQYSWFEGALSLEFLEKAVGYPMLAPVLKTHGLRQAPLPQKGTALWERRLRYTCFCNLFLQIFVKKKRGKEEGRKRNGRGKDKEL